MHWQETSTIAYLADHDRKAASVPGDMVPFPALTVLSGGLTSTPQCSRVDSCRRARHLELPPIDPSDGQVNRHADLGCTAASARPSSGCSGTRGQTCTACLGDEMKARTFYTRRTRKWSLPREAGTPSCVFIEVSTSMIATSSHVHNNTETKCCRGTEALARRLLRHESSGILTHQD